MIFTGRLVSIFLGMMPLFASAEECKVAVLLPLTGPVAEYGAATQNALKLLGETDPAPEITYQYGDNKFEAAPAVSAYRQLGAFDLLYNWGEPTTGSIAPLTDQDKRPLLAMSVDARPAIGRDNVIRTVNSSAQFVAKELGYLRRKGMKRMIVFMASDPFFEDQLVHLKAQLDSKGGEELVKTFSFEPDATDFRAAVTNARSLKFDAAFVYLFPGQASTLTKQLRGQGIKAQIIGTDIFESKTEIEQSEGTMEGAAFVSLAVPDNFRTAYTKRFGNDLQIAYAYNAYKIGKVIAKMCALPHGSPAEVLNGLKSNAAVAPDLEFKRDDLNGQYFSSTLVVRRIENGSIVDVE